MEIDPSQFDLARQAVEEEIAEELKTGRTLGSYFAYLMGHFLPVGVDSAMNFRAMNQSKMSKRISECLEETIGYSALYLNTTYADFYDDLDRAAEAEGIFGRKRMELDNLIKQRLFGNFQARESAAEALKPVYIRLKAFGYNRYDLDIGM